MTERTYTADEVDAMIARAVIAAKPPKREWVGLTDEELALCDEDDAKFARYWEAKLKEKNT